jgi:hypothetical protein
LYIPLKNTDSFLSKKKIARAPVKRLDSESVEISETRIVCVHRPVAPLVCALASAPQVLARVPARLHDHRSDAHEQPCSDAAAVVFWSRNKRNG